MCHKLLYEQLCTVNVSEAWCAGIVFNRYGCGTSLRDALVIAGAVGTRHAPAYCIRNCVFSKIHI